MPLGYCCAAVAEECECHLDSESGFGERSRRLSEIVWGDPGEVRVVADAAPAPADITRAEEGIVSAGE